MKRAIAVHPEGTFADEAEIASVTLAFADRHRRRVRLTDDAGIPFLLDLPRAVLLRDGMELELADSDHMIRVRAALEPILDIRCTDPVETAQVAWHLGNRHVAVQVEDSGSLCVQADHVIEDMVRGLGAIVLHRSAPFEPLGGAYGDDAHGAGHDHGKGHGHGHAA